MIVGIDLGTTNSLIAYFKDDEAHIIPNGLGENLTPSVVSVDKDGTVYVGRTAMERKYKYYEETAEVFKRSMGSRKQFVLGDKEFTAEDLSSLVLRSLKEDAEKFLGEAVDEAVISVPAYFNDAQRKATKRAGELAGFKVERIVNEPTAAAVAYGLTKDGDNKKFIVFDLGGGTFDVSILELYDNVMEVRAVAGDNYLGGEDFTRVLLQMFYNKYEIDEDKLSGKELTYLKNQAELCKKGFSDNRTSIMKCKLGEKEYEYEVSIDDYEKSCQILLQKIKKPVERSLKDAKISLSDIDEVILVGGATKLPIVRKFVSKLFGRLPNVSLNPDEVVAIGAASSAAMKERNESLKEVVLTDVCPYTLGTNVVFDMGPGKKESGKYLPIIERNSVIPISRTERLYTAGDDQEHIRVDILQGESRYARNNVLLGYVEVPVPVGPAGKEAVDLTFTYDVNSILEVEVVVISTKLKKRLVLKNEDSDLTEEEIDKRFEELAELKIHPKDKDENKLVLLRGERLYEESSGKERELIEYNIEQFEKVLDSHDEVEIRKVRQELKEFFDTIDSEI